MRKFENFITLWKEEEVLYNWEHEKYCKKDEKQKARKGIASKLISRGFIEIEDAQISEKSNYNGTKKRIEKASKASVVGPSNVCVSSWRFMNDLEFLNDNLIPRKSYSNIDLEPQEAFLSRKSGGNISVKSERLLKSKALERTLKIMVLVSQKTPKNQEVKDTAKSPERIFRGLIFQLLGDIPDGGIKDLAKIEVQQILVKVKHRTKSRERLNAPYTNSFNVTLTYGLAPTSQLNPSSIHSQTSN